jgi:glycosyltransferase involved in cell wall biosynthesis
MPEVSVIIPTHNRRALLERALASVRAQSWQDLEIIVVDDASADGTAEAMGRLNDARLRYLRHAAPRGEAAATNTGIAQAAGTYVAFLHDDDAWLPAKLERQVELFRRGDAKLGAIYCGFLSVAAQTGKELRAVLPVKRGDLSSELARQNWIGVPSTVMVRRECFEQVGVFDEGIVAGADYDMWIRLSRCYRFDYVPEALVLYSVHENRLSANYAAILRGKEAQLRKHHALFAADRQSYSQLLLSLGVLHCYNRDVRAGRRAFLRAIKSAPWEGQPYFNLLLSLCGAGPYITMKGWRDRLSGR